MASEEKSDVGRQGTEDEQHKTKAEDDIVTESGKKEETPPQLTEYQFRGTQPVRGRPQHQSQFERRAFPSFL